jgi:hypothetical protein
MSTSALILFGNMPVHYSVDIPPNREPVYEWAAPIFVTLAFVAGGFWLLRVRSAKTGFSRAILWLTAGFLLCSLSGWWVWSNRNGGTFEGTLYSRLIYWMPLVWVASVMTMEFARWRTARNRKAAETAIGSRSTELDSNALAHTVPRPIVVDGESGDQSI